MDNAEVKKIGNSEIDPLRAQIAKVGVLVGMKSESLPSSLETGILVNFLVGAYKFLEVSEISTAFEVALAGKFKCELECYGNLSSKYIAGVLNAYIEWKRKQVKPDYTMTALAETTEGGKDYENLKAVLSCFDRFKLDADCEINGASDFITVLNANGVKIMEHYGKEWRKHWEEMKYEAMQNADAQAQGRLYDEANLFKRKSLVAYIKGLTPDNCTAQAEEIALRRYFAYLIENSIELTHQINKK